MLQANVDIRRPWQPPVVLFGTRAGIALLTPIS